MFSKMKKDLLNFAEFKNKWIKKKYKEYLNIHINDIYGLRERTAININIDRTIKFFDISKV